MVHFTACPAEETNLHHLAGGVCGKLSCPICKFYYSQSRGGTVQVRSTTIRPLSVTTKRRSFLCHCKVATNNNEDQLIVSLSQEDGLSQLHLIFLPISVHRTSIAN